jgi:hypothetical protein
LADHVRLRSAAGIRLVSDCNRWFWCIVIRTRRHGVNDRAPGKLSGSGRARHREPERPLGRAPVPTARDTITGRSVSVARPISNRSAGWGNVRAVPDAPQVPIVASRRGRLESKCRNEETAGNSSILVDSLNSTCEPKASAGGTQRQIRSPRRPCPKYTCRRSSRRASGSWTPSCAWCYGYEPSRSTRSSGARKR